jgi:1-deoxy-D-xylulose-5-phosphate reductoisomerase
MAMIGVALLGATGSIGTSTLSLLRAHPDRFQLVAAAAQASVDKMLAICLEFRPAFVCLTNPVAANTLTQELKRMGSTTQVMQHADAMVELVQSPDVDCVVTGLSGAVGLAPTFAAVCAGKRVLIANKEALVMAGDLIIAAARQHRATLIPIDSEHNAIFQCVSAQSQRHEVDPLLQRVIITASGGPFLHTPLAELQQVTPEQAWSHPNWSMGKKISIDSATMANKGLEVIEASHLFALLPTQIEVVVHPQSIIHSLVEYVDGSLLTQLAVPDMRIPIALALSWPDRIHTQCPALSLTELARLEFIELDRNRYPAFNFALSALATGGTMPAIFNAANEVAVAAFITHAISFLDIAHVIEQVCTRLDAERIESLAHVIAVDAQARAVAELIIAK